MCVARGEVSCQPRQRRQMRCWRQATAEYVMDARQGIKGTAQRKLNALLICKLWAARPGLVRKVNSMISWIRPVSNDRCSAGTPS